MKKILYFDTETTGIDPVKNAIIQLSGIVEIDGEVKEEFNFRIQPLETDEISDQALAVNNITREQLKTYPTARHSFVQIQNLLNKYIDRFNPSDKFYAAGYNVRFDIDFLNQFFKKNFNNYFGAYFNWRTIDGLAIAHFLDYLEHINLPNYKLLTICNHYGIAIQAHDAMSDIRATRELILKFKSLLQISKVNYA